MDASVHPSELAYAFAYARTEAVIGWNDAVWQPTEDTAQAREDWLKGGEAKLVEAGRLTGDPETGLNFTDEMSSLVLALANPSLVLLAERKSDGGVRKMTVHASGDDVYAMSRRQDGGLDVTRHADLMAAAGACAGFVGASLDPIADGPRVEATDAVFAKIQQAGAVQPQKAGDALQKLGLADAAARSAIQALVSPAASGVLSTFYCANNAVQDAEVLTVLTNSDDETWLLHFPADAEGPMVLEQSSASGLIARVVVEIAARRTPMG